MDTHILIGDISKAQHHDEQSMLDLIARYDHLLQKYSRLLSLDHPSSYDDGYADLRCAFIILIYNFPSENNFLNDGAVSRYIEVSMRHNFERLRKKRLAGSWLCYYNEFTEEEVDEIEAQVGTLDDYSEIYINDAKHLLTQTEYGVFQRHYIQNMSIATIADQDHITRQVTNKTKNRALQKLQKFMCPN